MAEGGDQGAAAECDLLVVGSGAGGFAAAVTAAHHGLRVIIAEKHHQFGGTTAWSGGVLWVPCNPVSQAAGVEDSLDAARSYLRHEQAILDAGMVDAYLENAPRMVAFFQRETDVRFTHALHGDRHVEHPGGLATGRSIAPEPYDGLALGPWFNDLRPPPPETMLFGMQIGYGHEFVNFLNATRSLRAAMRVAGYFANYALSLARHGRNTRLYNGNALIARLARTAQRLPVDLWLASPVIDLVAQGGRVTGARLMRDGRPVTVRAAKGVVIATGGYPHDTRRVLETHAHVRSGSRHLSRAPLANTGDGIRMAEAVGAHFERNLYSPAALTPVSFVKRRDGSLSFQPHLFDRTKPGFIAVTPEGRRFGDEAVSYHDFVLSMIEHCNSPQGVRCYLICDHRALRTYGMGAARQAPLPIGRYLRSGYLVSGRTPQDLGEKLGMNGAVLAQTIARYNEGAAQGRDPEFHSGETAFTRLSGDPQHAPNPCVGPLTAGPFYAVEIFPGDIGTFAGLKTDGNARVLGQDGAAIAGLYATGNDMVSVMGGAYPAGGITIGPAMTFGYLAALHASRTNAD